MRELSSALFLASLLAYVNTPPALGKVARRERADGIEPIFAPTDRIIVTSDGNHRDEDDFFATPLALALLDAGGYKDRLVFYGYNNHIWDQHLGQAEKRYRHNGGSVTQGQMMSSIVTDSQNVFGLPDRIFHDESAAYRNCGGCFGARNPATRAFAAAVKASSFRSKLWVVASGPTETVYQYLSYCVGNKKGGSSRRLANVVLLSHSYHNNEHARRYHSVERVTINGRVVKDVPETGWGTLKLLLAKHGGHIHYGGFPCVDDCITKGSWLPVLDKALDDQNKGLDFEGKMSKQAGFLKYEWLIEGNWKLRFVHRMMMIANVADPSDAGIMYYLLSNDADTSPAKLHSYLLNCPSYSYYSLKA